VTGADEAAVQKRKDEDKIFLRRTLDDIELIRFSLPKLVAGDVAAWRDLSFFAQLTANGARGHELGVLRACAKELIALCEQSQTGAKLGGPFLLSVTTAIEIVARETKRVLRAAE
jgi:hypothetical protein